MQRQNNQRWQEYTFWQVQRCDKYHWGDAFAGGLIQFKENTVRWKIGDPSKRKTHALAWKAKELNMSAILLACLRKNVKTYVFCNAEKT